ncbi:terminase [Streptomyces sp. NBC_01498]|uniref:terminase n=1 Tax=Streptomyces sp. NBC_01498 TaxID=2975870 RepID=UPI002E7B0801|nr:terminase [Streptomyces sp. NBC_01498]WTL23968.1 terminase [Streptomyces sp. NBC_01498]
MPWKPPEPGAVPSLGYEVIDWISAYLAAPDRGDYEPFLLYPEQEDFVLRYYEINPQTGKRRFRRGVISRPRGWGKSPFLAALAIVEALGPVVPDGWDADGQPVGKPWSEVRTPLVQIAAVSETQTKNTWAPLLEMLQGPVIDEYVGLEPLDTFVNLPRGRIEPITSSARTVKGNKPVFAVLDQTEEWVKSNRGNRLAETMRINAAKIGGTTIESPNAFIPGEGSVAEESAAFWAKIREGRARDDGLFYDHREAPPETDMADRQSLIAGLTYTYGDSADRNGGHVDLDTLVSTIWDPSTDPQTARADFLNQITHASDSWISQPEWAGTAAPAKVVGRGEEIVIGFDGSRRRNRGVTDATALVGCRVSDGHLFLLGCWEQPDGPFGQDWQVPTVEVLTTVEDAFRDYNVVGMYADPARWESHIAKWEADHGRRLKLKASTQHPIEWWMTGGRANHIVRALEKFRSSVVDGELTHDGSSVMTRHILNARRRESRSGLQIMKEHPDSPKKIDVAIAAVLAWQARVDAMAKGLGKKKTGRSGRVVVLR